MTIPAEQNCTSGCTGTLTNGSTVNPGQTLCFTGGPSSFGSITLNGGTIVICGDLTINNLNLNSGSVFVSSTGNFTINNGFNMNGNAHFTNYGTLTFSGNINMQNGNNDINNAAGAVFNAQNISMTGTGSTPGHTINNAGTANIQKLSVNSGNNNINLGDASTMNLTTLASVNNPNAFCVEPGECSNINISGSAQMNQPLTDDSGLRYCNTGTESSPPGGGSGSATVSCADCSIPLAIDNLFELNANYISGNTAKISWKFNNNEALIEKEYFIEKTINGEDFALISSTITENNFIFETFDQKFIEKIAYYRLVEIDKDGNIEYSQLVSVQKDSQSTQVNIFPTICSESVNIQLFGSDLKDYELELYNAVGKKVFSNTFPISKIKHYTSDLNLQSSGVYIVKLTAGKNIFTKKIIVK